MARLLAVSVRDVIVCEALAGPCGGPGRVLRPVCGADIDSANAVGIFFLSIALTFIGFSPDTSM